MESNSACKTVLLPDVPEKTDSFNGAHVRLANSIVQLIETEDGGKTIGLEGTWGSGKSTIINLLKKELLQNANNSIVLFDAWAHQGDPLRRTFLETIAKHLIEKEWVNKEDWENELEILAKRKQVTKTTSSPSLTTLGTLIAVASLLVPMGISFLNTALRNQGEIIFLEDLF